MYIDSEIVPASKTADLERYFVAVHEAGHVVMSFEQELDVEEVSIIPEGDRLGLCRNAGCPEWPELVGPPRGADREKELSWRQLIVKHIQVSLAGPEAERLARGAANPAGAAGDEEAIRLLTNLLSGGEDTAVASFIDWLRFRTARYLSRPRVQYTVAAIARGLLHRGRMTGKEAGVLYARAAARAIHLPRLNLVSRKSETFTHSSCSGRELREE